MDFSDIIDVFSNLFLIGSTKENTKEREPKKIVQFASLIFLIVGIIWFVVELNSIFTLLSPVWFLSLFTSIGSVLSLVLVSVLYQIGFIEQIHKKEFFVILVSTCLMSISSMSSLNRNFGTGDKIYMSCSTLNNPINQTNSAKVLIDLDGEKINVKVSLEISTILNQGDKLKIEITKGFVGFNYISRSELSV